MSWYGENTVHTLTLFAICKSCCSHQDLVMCGRACVRIVKNQSDTMIAVLTHTTQLSTRPTGVLHTLQKLRLWFLVMIGQSNLLASCPIMTWDEEIGRVSSAAIRGLFVQSFLPAIQFASGSPTLGHTTHLLLSLLFFFRALFVQ